MSLDRSGDCWRCGRALQGGEFARGELCPGCRSETRCCRNCGLHAPSLHNGCREPQSDPVSDKEKSNFCEFFQPRTAPPAGSPPAGSARESSPAKEKFEALFRKRPATQGDQT